MSTKFFKVALWPLTWLIDSARSLFEIKMEDGEWLMPPFSPFGAPVSVAAMLIIIVAYKYFGFRFGIGESILITSILYIVGAFCEYQNYIPGNLQDLYYLTDVRRHLFLEENPLFPFVLVQSCTIALIVAIWFI